MIVFQKQDEGITGIFRYSLKINETPARQRESSGELEPGDKEKANKELNLSRILDFRFRGIFLQKDAESCALESVYLCEWGCGMLAPHPLPLVCASEGEVAIFRRRGKN